PRPGTQSFADLVAALPSLDPGAASDYGRAFYQARPAVRSIPSRDSILVVLGDARTNRRDPQSWAFEEIASRCRRVIWLNPEPRDQWDTGDSVMHEYMAHCDVACEVRDLEGLALGVREILRGL
ncbi:MAG TPA: VWA domain-containing protein, partial [Candidatus Saccharimonadales bacterium]|nr:VWA domain-containing protein [Candidatus Saccharimonadales bacterium]